MEPLISIIIPVYNVEKYLPACLESVINQTYQNLEVLLINDGSKDSSGLICDQYASKDSRIRVFHQENGGVASARNVGLRAFTGEYVMFVDSDDTITLDAVQILYERMASDCSDMAVGKHLVVTNKYIETDPEVEWRHAGLYTSDKILELIGEGKGFILALWGKLFRRAILEKIEVPNLISGEDTYIFPEIFEKCEYISVVNNTVYRYFQRQNSLTHTPSDCYLLDTLVGGVRMLRYLYKNGYVNSCQSRLDYWLTVALHLDDKKKGRTLLVENFSNHEIKNLFRGISLKVKIKWISLYVPVIYKVVRKMKDLLGFY